jgi:hypothetical protein
LNLRFTRQPTEAATIGVQEAPERGTMDFATHRAVAVIDELRRSVELETHRAAKA